MLMFLNEYDLILCFINEFIRSFRMKRELVVRCGLRTRSGHLLVRIMSGIGCLLLNTFEFELKKVPFCDDS